MSAKGGWTQESESAPEGDDASAATSTTTLKDIDVHASIVAVQNDSSCWNVVARPERTINRSRLTSWPRENRLGRKLEREAGMSGRCVGQFETPAAAALGGEHVRARRIGAIEALEHMSPCLIRYSLT